MTFHHAVDFVTADRQRAFRPSLTGRIIAIAQRAVGNWKNRRTARRLLELDDHMLTDIGVTRGDVQQMLANRGRLDPTSSIGSLARRGQPAAPTVRYQSGQWTLSY